eukprot:PLAT231.6.p2 GENE.PLAT231.6~~PLAT231.6.p2  ORF type:complete len:303 (+),score=116.67 PLAT231.6:22-909(+)
MAAPSPFRADLLNGSVVLITGGGSGIGFGIAQRVVQHGAAVMLTGRREAVLQAAVAELQAAGGRAAYKTSDVRKPEMAEAVVRAAEETFGGLDILVNCAAGNFLCAAEDLSPKGFATVVAIDLLGTFNYSKAALPALRRSRRSPAVINISATLHYGATWWQSAPSAAKAGIDSLTRSLALEWAEFGIRVNGVAPGPIAGTTGLNKLSGGMSTEQLEKVLGETLPLGRIGRKSDIADAVIFLSSSAAPYVTGSTLVVDGACWLFYPPRVDKDTVRSFSRKLEKTGKKVGLPTRSKL